MMSEGAAPMGRPFAAPSMILVPDPKIRFGNRLSRFTRRTRGTRAPEKSVAHCLWCSGPLVPLGDGLGVVGFPLAPVAAGAEADAADPAAAVGVRGRAVGDVGDGDVDRAQRKAAAQQRAAV